MLRIQIVSLAASAVLASLMPGFQSDKPEKPSRVHLTSMQSGLVPDETPTPKKAEVTDFKGAGFQDAEDWGSTVDRRLAELERKVALCPCSNTKGATPAAATAGATTTKETIVRSDMKPQEVADALTKLGFKSTVPAPVQTVYAMATIPATTWQTSSYAAPQPTYWVPQVPPRRVFRAKSATQNCTPVLVNGQWVCQ